MCYREKYLLFCMYNLKMGDNLCRMDYSLSLKKDILGNFGMLIIE
jgi:hypothetical protein